MQTTTAAMAMTNAERLKSFRSAKRSENTYFIEMIFSCWFFFSNMMCKEEQVEEFKNYDQQNFPVVT